MSKTPMTAAQRQAARRERLSVLPPIQRALRKAGIHTDPYTAADRKVIREIEAHLAKAKTLAMDLNQDIHERYAGAEASPVQKVVLEECRGVTRVELASY